MMVAATSLTVIAGKSKLKLAKLKGDGRSHRRFTRELQAAVDGVSAAKSLTCSAAGWPAMPSSCHKECQSVRTGKIVHVA